MPDLDGDGVPDGIFGSNDAGETDNFEVAESSGLHMFSLRGIVAFFCIFGWLGLTMVSNGTEEWLAVLVAFIGGFLAMLGVAFLLKALSKLQSDGIDEHPLCYRCQRQRVYYRSAAAPFEGQGKPARTGKAGGAGRPLPMKKRRCLLGRRLSSPVYPAAIRLLFAANKIKNKVRRKR